MENKRERDRQTDSCARDMTPPYNNKMKASNEFIAECCSVYQCVAMCCSVLQCVAVCCSVLQCVAVCSSVLQCVAVCCSVLQCVAVCCSVYQCVAVCCSVLQCVAVCISALQCVAVRRSALQSIVLCCSAKSKQGGVLERIPQKSRSAKELYVSAEEPCMFAQKRVPRICPSFLCICKSARARMEKSHSC